MHCRRLLTLGPDNEPLWVRLYVHRIEDRWAAEQVGDDAPPLVVRMLVVEGPFRCNQLRG